MLLSQPVAVLATLICFQFGPPVTSIRIERSRYLDINVEIDPSVPSDRCRSILSDLESTLTQASKVLHDALDGRAYFGDFNILLPKTWADSCIPHSDNLPLEHNRTDQLAAPVPAVATGGRSDITVTHPHSEYGDSIWTQQFGGCGIQGDQIYAAYGAFSSMPSKEFVRNWAKYRYGVFDEIGYLHHPVYTPCYFNDSLQVTGCSDAPLQEVENFCKNPGPPATVMQLVAPTARTSLMFAPQIESVVMFCDKGNHNRYAPTKQNLLCDRQPTLDVILQHSDFAPANLATPPAAGVTNTLPHFSYKRRTLTRYVVVIDDSQDILLRDSWSFLRSAMRKWLVYDLPPQTEVGIVLANSLSNIRSIPLTPLNKATTRDLVASFVPYGPSDSSQATCISCALHEAQKMLAERASQFGNASHVILVISPGMEFGSVENITQHVQKGARARIVTINFPVVSRRQPLDELAHATDGKAYSVYESKVNSEKSYLHTYVELITVLLDISRTYYEGSKRDLPVEIHRATFQDAVNATSLSQGICGRFNGTFYMDASFANPAGFYVYTYSAENPLVQTMRLTSPGGRVYETRTDQRMPVKQLSLIASLNESGSWTYEIERFHGNPQPHIVQVQATPVGESPFVHIRAWATRHGSGAETVFILYCALKHGDYPVIQADVRVSVRRHDQDCSNKPQHSDCTVEYNLVDSGSGSPDITYGDGIYTRLFRARKPSVYTFEIRAASVQGRTYTISAEGVKAKSLSCGKSHGGDQQSRAACIPHLSKLTEPFERFAAPLTFLVDAKKFDGSDLGEKQSEDGTGGESKNVSKKNNLNSDQATGQVGDLRMSILADGKLLLQWTSPDVADNEVARYELKYGFQLGEMIDRFDSASVLWNHETPTPLPLGEEQRLVVDPNLEQNMMNQSVYFGVRVYTSLSKGATPGPVSNIVGAFVPLPQLRVPATTDAASGGATQDDQANNPNTAPHNDTRNSSEQPSVASVKRHFLHVLLPVAISLMVALILLLAVCVICKMRRFKPTDFKMGGCTEINAAPTQGVVAAEPESNEIQSAPTALEQSTTISYTSSEVPDLHTVGIPIFECSEDDSGCNKTWLPANGTLPASHASGLQSYVIDEAQKPPKNCFYGGLSIISLHTDNLRRNQPPPNNCDSWSQSMLLSRDSQCGSPYAEALHHQQVGLDHHVPYNLPAEGEAHGDLCSLDANIPPVPPLPNSTRLYQTSPTHATDLRRCNPHNLSLDSRSHCSENGRRMRSVTMV